MIGKSLNQYQITATTGAGGMGEVFRPRDTRRVTGGKLETFVGLKSSDRVGGWTADGRSLFVARGGILPVPVERLDWATGQRKLWKQLAPPDPAGILHGPWMMVRLTEKVTPTPFIASCAVSTWRRE